MHNKIAAIVFLYHFDEICLDNIRSYHKDVNIVYAFDNSEKKDEIMISKLKQLEGVTYVDGEDNKGLGYPINYVAKLAWDTGHQWLITFDQDSKAEQNMIHEMVMFLDNYDKKKIKEIGILAPSICQKNDIYKRGSAEFSYNAWVIQSGALHNLECLKNVGGYNEQLFIDQVDIEYCVRLRKNHFSIIKLNNAVLNQNVKDKDVYSIRKNGKKMIINKFDPIRYYYITRNVLYCTKLYKKENDSYYYSQRDLMFKVWRSIKYEKYKWKKYKAILLGIYDFMRNKSGKCTWKI